MAKQNDKVCYVTLPYDFISFAETNDFPYRRANVPGHDSKNGLGGCLSYTITPCSDLAMEVRARRKGGYFVGGSQIRGKIRSNLEILSAAYPEFISHTPMLYRDFSGVSKESYKERMGLSNGIERAVQAGFLIKEDNEFYVIPAQQFGDKYFLSIKEHRLMKLEISSASKSFSTIFKWEEEEKTEFDELQNRIEDLTRKIKSQREDYKDKLNSEEEKEFNKIQKQISQVFLDKYNFNKKLMTISRNLNRNKHKNTTPYNYKSDLESIKKDLCKDLQKRFSDKKELLPFYQLTAKRWQLKAELYIKYRLLKKNKGFLPYQRNVYYHPDGQGIEKIAVNASAGEDLGKAYLFNSTNAGSKRSHYFVLEAEPGHKGYPVPQSVIDSYRQYFKKIRIIDEKDNNNENKRKFYDIFDSYEEIQKESKGANGIIVFFRSSQKETGKEEVIHIGRTPYFKIPYKQQLEQLLGKKEKNKVDYAEALFGFINDEQRGDDETKIAYKSRLRFSPVDISGQPDIYCKEFLLPTPYASSSAMYLQQGEESALQTYEDENLCLNGYKYYHILKEPIKVSKQGKPQNMLSGRKIIKKDSIEGLTGKIYFDNLSEAELGLLLLSIDLKQLLKSERYKEIAAKYQAKLEHAYDLLGGAKPYGYGKVKIEIDSLEIEKKGNDFASLILEPMQTVEKWHQYIDAFIADMGGQQYFERVHFDQYLQSKLEIDAPAAQTDQGQGKRTPPKHYNWNDTSAFKKGYNKKWRLCKNFFLDQGQSKSSIEKS